MLFDQFNKNLQVLPHQDDLVQQDIISSTQKLAFCVRNSNGKDIRQPDILTGISSLTWILDPDMSTLRPDVVCYDRKIN